MMAAITGSSSSSNTSSFTPPTAMGDSSVVGATSSAGGAEGGGRVEEAEAAWSSIRRFSGSCRSMRCGSSACRTVVRLLYGDEDTQGFPFSFFDASGLVPPPSPWMD